MMNNTNSTNNSGTGSGPSTVDVIVLCIFIIAFITTLVTNGITIFIITKTSALRTRTNAFIVSLSASDTLYAMFMLGLSIAVMVSYFSPVQLNGAAIQRYTWLAWSILIHSSNGNLILVSVERWIYIIHPFWHQRHVSNKSVAISIATLWISAIAVNFPYIFIHDSILMDYFATCHAYVYPTIHTLCSLMLIVIYTHITVTTFRHMKTISRAKPQDNNQEGNVSNNDRAAPVNSRRSIHAENWKAAKLLIIICGLYFACVGPYVYLYAHILLHPQLQKPLNDVYTASLFLLSFHRGSNFFVYVLRTRQFRKALKQHFNSKICFRSRRVGHGGSGSEGTATYMDGVTRTQRGTEKCVITDAAWTTYNAQETVMATD